MRGVVVASPQETLEDSVVHAGNRTREEGRHVASTKVEAEREHRPQCRAELNHRVWLEVVDERKPQLLLR